jgi:hypothetical protein
MITTPILGSFPDGGYLYEDGGYSEVCNPDAGQADCPSGFNCALMPDYGFENSPWVCAKLCDTNPNCGPGEICAPDSSGANQICNTDETNYCQTQSDCPSGDFRCENGVCEGFGC